MNSLSACTDCLRRSWLLAMLAPYLERHAISEAVLPMRELLAYSDKELIALASPELTDHLLAKSESFQDERMRDQLAKTNCWACCYHSAEYPYALSDFDDGPPALIGRGDPGLLAELEPRRTVAIVGARRATSYGREMARQLAHDLAAEGFTIVSGLSFGIDGCAHRGALDEGRTVGVLGCGPDISYPESHRSLWRRISDNGAVVSELPPGTAPWRWTLRARSRIVAGLAGVTVVVEAVERSGSLTTADASVHLSRKVGAVPGPVTSRASTGSNSLLADGAFVVRNAQDIMDALASAALGCRRGERS